MSSGPPRPAFALAAEAFKRWRGHWPSGVWSAPGRVNLIGEHTDYCDGLVMPFALPWRTTVAASTRTDGVLAMASVDPDGREWPRMEVHLDELQQRDPALGWARYPAGMAWILASHGVPLTGADILVRGEVQPGAGLASSHALLCATGLALLGISSVTLDPIELARLVRRAENEFVGVPSGMMDQTAALLCTRAHALLLDTRSMATRLLPLDPPAAGLELVVIDTTVRHELVEAGYRQRRHATAGAAQLLGVSALRDVEPAELPSVESRLPARLTPLVRHVVTENARVAKAGDLIAAGRLPEIGPLLTASHRSLAYDYKVSCAELDTAVAAALGAGALGARLTGGGFGGSVIALTPAPLAVDVAEATAKEFAQRGFRPPTAFAVMPAAGASRDA